MNIRKEPFNPFSGTLTAIFDTKEETFCRSIDKDSIIDALLWTTDYGTDSAYIVGSKFIDGASTEFLQGRGITIPMMARREVIRTMVSGNGMSPTNSSTSLSIFDLENIFDSSKITVQESSRSNPYNPIPTKNTALDRFLSQKPPMDPSDRLLISGAFVTVTIKGKPVSCLINEILGSKIIVSSLSASDNLVNVAFDQKQLRIFTSKKRLQTKNTIPVDRKDLDYYLFNNKNDISEKALGEGVTIKLSDGCSLDVRSKNSNIPPLYQLYNPDNISLGVYDRKGVSRFNDVFDFNAMRAKSLY